MIVDLESQIPEFLGKLEELVTINTFRYNRRGVDAAGDLVAGWFTPLDFTAVQTASEHPEAGHHLILRKEGSGGPHLLYIAHLDTVYPEGLAADMDWRFRVDGKRATGPGVVDCKGGIALLWLILETLRNDAPELFGKLSYSFVLNATEEGGCRDFPALLGAEITPRTVASIGMEPGRVMDEAPGGGFVVSRKGSRRFVLEVTGREAHSGTHHSYGVSAVRELARKIEAIEGLTNVDSGITVNVGVISGGTSLNTVPGNARGEIDIRFETEGSVEPVVDRLRKIVGTATVASREDGHFAALNLVELPGYPAWPPGSVNEELVNLVVATSRRLGAEARPYASGGGSDSAYSGPRVPAVDGLGPVGGDSHMAGREYLHIPSVVQRARLHVDLIRNLVSGGA